MADGVTVCLVFSQKYLSVLLRPYQTLVYEFGNTPLYNKNGSLLLKVLEIITDIYFDIFKLKK